MRAQIRTEIEGIVPFDDIEASNKSAAINWIDTGTDLCRLRKSDFPPKHLIVYFVVVDGDHILLVDHINARLWLPTGGHVDPGEHPRSAVIREAVEELGVTADFATEAPIFLSIIDTVGKTGGHTDVALWYVLKGRRDQSFDFDGSEFHRLKWYHRNDVPVARTDAQMGRFLDKYFGSATP